MQKPRAPRKNHDSVLEIYDHEGNLVTGIGRLVNVSASGACFSSTQSLASGEKLHVRIRLLDEGPLEASATIVWTRKQRNTTQYGLSFTNVKKAKAF